jgi:acetolactate synthase-1/2/3 large subunit
MVHIWQKLFFDDRCVATDNINPDYVKLAEAYDIEAFRIETVEELDAGCERMMRCKGPVLVEFIVKPDVCLPMVAPGKALDDIIKFGDVTVDNVEIDTENTGSFSG